MRRLAEISALTVIFLAWPVSSCASDEPPTPSQRWERLSSDERKAVCKQVTEGEIPDYQGMVRAMMDTGMTEPDASTVLLHAVEECA